MSKFFSLGGLALAAISSLAAATGFAAAPDGYYDKLVGLNKANLMTAAKNLVRSHNVVSYGSSTWDAFEQTDVRVVNGKRIWWDMYSDNEVEVSSGHSSLNIEHAVANSWWGQTKNDAYKDLFHLNPSDATANNRKSNYPMGIVADVTWENGVTTVGRPESGTCGGATYVYEPPKEYKGDFARAFFYIFTVYNDISWKLDASDGRDAMYDGSTYPALKPWAYQMLLEWSAEDPVSQKEIDRNEAIYAIQNNRNPFIDHPELAEYIWGSKKELGFSLTGEGVDPVDPSDPDTPTDPEDPEKPAQVGNGTLENPYVTSDILYGYATGSGVWFEGYVVGGAGFIADTPFTGLVFFGTNAPSSYSNTNMVMAATADCKDASECVPVQLPAGTLRQELGVTNNPSIVGSKILIKGNPDTYFSVPGFKNASEWQLVEGASDPVDPSDPEDPEQPGETVGDGSEENPYTAADIISGAATGSGVWYKAYIVGCIDGTSYSNLTFDVSDLQNYNNTNIATAASLSCTDPDLCVPVQLPTGVRPDLGLTNNPDAYHKLVMLKGNVEKYFSKPGFKSVSEYRFIDPSGVAAPAEELKSLQVVNCDGMLKFVAKETARDVRLFDVTGRCVLSLPAVENGTMVSLPRGIYILVTPANTKPVKLIM